MDGPPVDEEKIGGRVFCHSAHTHTHAALGMLQQVSIVVALADSNLKSASSQDVFACERELSLSNSSKLMLLVSQTGWGGSTRARFGLAECCFFKCQRQEQRQSAMQSRVQGFSVFITGRLEFAQHKKRKHSLGVRPKAIVPACRLEPCPPKVDEHHNSGELWRIPDGPIDALWGAPLTDERKRLFFLSAKALLFLAVGIVQSWTDECGLESKARAM